MTIQNYAEVFKALSDPNRLRILKMLEQRTLCVCEIRDVLKLAPSTVSQHLKILKENAYIKEEKKGRWVYYSLNAKPLYPEITALRILLHTALNDTAQVQSDVKKIQSSKVITCS